MNENIKESRRTLVWSVSVVLCGLAGIWWGARMGSALLHAFGLDLRPELCVLMLLALMIQGLSNLKADRKYSGFYRFLVWYSGILIPVLIYGLITMVLLDIVIFLIHFFSGSPTPGYNLSALIALPVSFAVTIYGLIHARKITVKHYDVNLPDYSEKDPRYAAEKRVSAAPAAGSHSSGQNPSEFENSAAMPASSTRIVQLSDLHMGSVVGFPYVKRILEKTAELHPDYVVLTGDIFNHGFVEECAHPEKVEEAFRQLNKAICSDKDNDKDNLLKENTSSSKGGSGKANRSASHASSHASVKGSRVFAILGNHDPLPDDPALRQFLNRSDITLLHNRTVSLPEFYLAGRGGNHVDHRPELSGWLSSVHHRKPLILLDHYPDGIHEAERANVDLMLSGHTHGGQYFPCNLLIMKHYAHGLMHGYSVWGNTQSIVSWGAGFFQIPIRVGTDSEIVCVDVH